MKVYLVYEFRQYWTASKGKVDILDGFNDLHEAKYEVEILGIFDSDEKAQDFRKNYDKKEEVDSKEEFEDGFIKTATVELEMNQICSEFLMKEDFTEVF